MLLRHSTAPWDKLKDHELTRNDVREFLNEATMDFPKYEIVEEMEELLLKPGARNKYIKSIADFKKECEKEEENE